MSAASLLLRRAGPLEAPLLAVLHEACFPDESWQEPDLAALTAAPGGFALLALLGTEPAGFALARAAADEAEILSLGVLPDLRRRGIGRALVEALCRTARDQGARALYLEVAADNGPALALYGALGFRQSGVRRNYYRRPSGRAADALLLRRRLTGLEGGR